jgi:hypothetical protein
MWWYHTKNILGFTVKLSAAIFVITYAGWSIYALDTPAVTWGFSEALSFARNITIYLIPVSIGLAWIDESM